MKYKYILIFLLISSCSIFYKSVLKINTPINTTKDEMKLYIAKNIFKDSLNILDYYFNVDDTVMRIKSFNSSVVNLYQIFDINGSVYKPVSNGKGCQIDELNYISKNYQNVLIVADSNKVKSENYLVFKNINELLNSSLPFNTFNNRSKKRIILLIWSRFANNPKDVSILSQKIMDTFNKDSFQLIRLNCDLVDSKFKQFSAKLSKGSSFKDVDISFHPQ